MIVAENDQFVLIERQRSTFERIQATGAPIELVSVPFVIHGFEGLPNSFGAQFVEHIVQSQLHELG